MEEFSEDFREPTYCAFYKNLLVEEISLYDYPHQLHYGKCAIIGLTSRSKDGFFHLQNVKINSIDKEFQIPNCSTSIILIDTLVLGCVPIGKACEVFGEVILLDSYLEHDNILPKTSKDLFMEISNFIEDNSKSKNEIAAKCDEMKKRYLPGIRAHAVSIVEQPMDLIECNLAIRCLILDCPS